MKQIYIAIAIVVLLIIAILKWRRGEQKKLSQLTILSFAFIMGGLIFGDDPLLGYSFLGLGVLFAVIDMIKKFRSKQPTKF
jgi:TctA family transporter